MGWYGGKKESEEFKGLNSAVSALLDARCLLIMAYLLAPKSNPALMASGGHLQRNLLVGLI
jgi:hypothetical protein